MSTVPAPFVFATTGSWNGDDGSWSTFHISVGTPPQSFRILPSTTGAEIWLPSPVGCDGFLANVSNCGALRGVNNFNGIPSRGFETNASSTWDTLGIYELATEQNLWGTSGTTGLYGLDTVSLSEEAKDDEATLTSQTVAAVASENVWVGSLGLGTALANYSIESEYKPSLLDSMQDQNVVPSQSFGYTAGASYAGTLGSLIFGGYDQARFTPSNLSLPIGGSNQQSLPIDIKSIIVENSAEGTLSLLPNGKAITTIIDSTVSQLWLPQNVCDLFAKTFNLTYEPVTGLYLVNATVHKQLKQDNPSFTFTLGGQDETSAMTNIVLPYAAFDLQAGFPIFTSGTNYFPIRVAANESQQVLGRAFLQEAYIVVDWERGNFTIGQAIQQTQETNIIAIAAPTSHGGSLLLSKGLIAAVVVGGVAVLASIVGLAIFFILRARWKRPRPPLVISKPIELQSSCSAIYEMDESQLKHELVCTQISELSVETPARELDAEDTKALYELP